MFRLLHCHFESVLRAIAIERPELLNVVYSTFASTQFRAAPPAQRLHFLEERIQGVAEAVQGSIFTEEVFERVVQTFLYELEMSQIEHVDLRIGICTKHWRWMHTIADAIAVFERELRRYPTLSISFLVALNLAKPCVEFDGIVELLLHDPFIQQTCVGIDMNVLPADGAKLRWYAPSVRTAQQKGMNLNIHLGELFDNDFSQEILSYLTPRRIGHGVKLLEDELLVAFLQQHHICLDMCPVSNTRLGVWDWTQPNNPARKAMQLGIPCTINTDDPMLFQTTLSHEFELARLNDEEVRLIQAAGRAYGYCHE